MNATTTKAGLQVQPFFDPRTSSLTYVVHRDQTAVVIDPVLDYDPKSGRVFYESAERVARYVESQNLQVLYALDTHPHADHLTGLAHYRDRFGAKTVISSGITNVQQTWKAIFNLGDEFAADGSQFDVLLDDNDTLDAGPLRIEAILTEGHTPASLTYKIEDTLFVGDLLFMPDAGTARTDFPGGSAEVMHEAIQRLYQLPDETWVYTLHDYQPGGRELRCVSTLGEHKRANIQINQDTTREQFVTLRRRLEHGKEMPTLLLPSLQVNIRGGRLPSAEGNGVAYFKIPLNQF